MTQRHRNPWLDCSLLTALCGVMYFLAPTAHGLTNWQESMRALVARQMHGRLAAGEPWAWAVPTVWGEPYLAKPPVIYWCQLLLTKITGGSANGEPGELELRLTVAIAGWMGVLATYLSTRSLLRQPRSPFAAKIAPPADVGPNDSSAPSAKTPQTRRPYIATPSDDVWPDHVAWWSALFLATGILYAHSARIGELDILLVPPTVVAVWAIARAWRFSRDTARSARTDFVSIAIATVGATIATLTKGPPALLVIGLAAYGGIILWAALDPEPLAGPRLTGVTSQSRSGLPGLVLRIGGMLIGLGIAAAGSSGRWNVTQIVGLAIIAATILGLLWLAARLADRDRVIALWNVLKRTHPVGVLGVPLLVFWGWTRLVAHAIGAATVEAAGAEEAADNLRLFVPDSPINNLEAAAYGVGLGSIAAIIAAIWLIKDKPRKSFTWYIPIGWVVLGLAAFSLLGKGVPRYLTPLWPGIAILGGMWMTSAIRDFAWGKHLARAGVLAVVALALGQGYWYAYGREKYFSGRSPRAFIHELAPRLDAAPDERLVTFEFSTPALDFYSGRPIESFHDVVPRKNLRMVGPRTLTDLHEDLAAGGACLILMRETQPGSMEPKPARDCLRDAGFEIEPQPLTARFIIDNGRTNVVVARVRAVAPSPSMPAPTAPQ